MKEVLRTCCACRTKHKKNDLHRISKQNEKVVIDEKKQFGGKATYVCKNFDCITMLLNKKILNKVFKYNFNSEVYKKIGEELIETKHN